MFVGDPCQCSRIRTRADLECERRAFETVVQRRRDDVIKRREPKSSLGVEQSKILGVRVVVAKKDAYQDAAEEPVHILFSLRRLIRENEFCHLAVRAIVLRLRSTPEQLVEFLEVSLSARRRPIKSPDEKTCALDSAYRRDFDLHNLIVGQQNTRGECCQIFYFNDIRKFPRRKLRNMRAPLAGACGAKRVAIANREQLWLNPGNGSAVRERRNLFRGSLFEIRFTRRPRIANGNCSGAIPSECQKPGEAIFGRDA